jgi:hypothetical protein
MKTKDVVVRCKNKYCCWIGFSSDCQLKWRSGFNEQSCDPEIKLQSICPHCGNSVEFMEE